MKHYIFYTWQDVEPQLLGPYDSNEIRDEIAKHLRREDIEENGEASGIYAIDISDNGVVSTDSYSGMFFDDIPDEREPLSSILDPHFWDCECKDRFIHSARHQQCPVCGNYKKFQPDSRKDEVKKYKYNISKINY